MPDDALQPDALQSAIALFLMAPFLAAGGSVFGGLVTWLALRRAAGQEVPFWSAYLTHFFVNALFMVVAGPLDLMMRTGGATPTGAMMVQLGIVVFYNLALALMLCRNYGLAFPQGLRVVIETEVLAIRCFGIVGGLLAAYALGGIVSG